MSGRSPQWIQESLERLESLEEERDHLQAARERGEERQRELGLEREDAFSRLVALDGEHEGLSAARRALDARQREIDAARADLDERLGKLDEQREESRKKDSVLATEDAALEDKRRRLGDAIATMSTQITELYRVLEAAADAEDVESDSDLLADRDHADTAGIIDAPSAALDLAPDEQPSIVVSHGDEPTISGEIEVPIAWATDGPLESGAPQQIIRAPTQPLSWPFANPLARKAPRPRGAAHGQLFSPPPAKIAEAAAQPQPEPPGPVEDPAPVEVRGDEPAAPHAAAKSEDDSPAAGRKLFLEPLPRPRASKPVLPPPPGGTRNTA